jgi:hypothetical protein
LNRSPLAWLALAACLLLMVWQPAAAQEPALAHRVQRLRVQVMPEFDDPRVLVVAQGRLALDGADLPVEVTFRVPRGVQINQMASMDMSTGATASRTFQVKPDPDDARWSLVTYALDDAHFFYEYYYDPIAGQTDKHFALTFSSLQAVDDLALEVQQPLAATDFETVPAPTTTRTDESMGFTYHRIQVGALAAGGEASVEVSYTKTDPAPSVSREQMADMQKMSAPAEASVVGAAGPKNGVPLWACVLFGAATVTAVGGFIWYNGRPGGTSATRPPPVESDLFCARCGAALKDGALFCHACGASSRRLNEQPSF